jgi:hypothetical protein
MSNHALGDIFGHPGFCDRPRRQAFSNLFAVRNLLRDLDGGCGQNGWTSKEDV